MKLLGVLALGCVASGVQAGSTPINIGNFVWNDVNGDGTQHANEPGMSGVVVQRWNDSRTQLLDSSTSSPTVSRWRASPKWRLPDASMTTPCTSTGVPLPRAKSYPPARAWN